MNLVNNSNIESRILVNLPGVSFDNQFVDTSFETPKGNVISFTPVY